MTRRELLRKCAEASQLSQERCGEVLDLVGFVIRRETASARHLMIDDFGVFQQSSRGRSSFRPARRLLERLANYHVPEDPQTEGDVEQPQRPLPDSILAVHPVPRED